MGRSVRRLSVERLESRDLLCSFESLIDLNCLFPENGGDGSQGVALLAPESGRRGNFESAGDFNGDGFFDFVLVNTDQPAPAYLFLGGQDRPALLNLDTSPLESVATFEGALRYVSAADFNGDGLTDLLTGSPGDSTEGSLTGQARIWFGHSDLRSEYLNSELDGRNGVVIQGDRDLTFLGDWHSEIGDFNGDGLDDFAVSGTFGRTPEGLDLVGYVAVVYGSDDELPSPMHPFQHFDGSLGSVIFGEDDNDQFGRVVLPVGDINGDRYDDFYVRSSTEAKSGVFFGSEAGIGFNISDFPEFGVHSLDGTNGFSGSSIRVNVGDFNGDGIEDTVGNSVDGGVVRLGGITTFPPQLPQLTPQDGVLFPTSSSLSPLGDIDGDGFDDLRVYYQEDSYDSRLAFGGPYQSSTTFDRARALPFSFLEQGYLGGVRSVGDINGDGFDDMLLRYWSDRVWTPSDPNLPFGFLVYGQDFRGVVTHAGTEGDDVLEGTSADDVLIGGLGDDTIRGGGGADSLRGAAGNDKLSVADVDFRRVDGGTGVDTLVWEVPHGELNLISIGTQRLKSIEKIDLRSAGANTLVLDRLAVLQASETSNDLYVWLDESDSIQLLDDWAYLGTEARDDESWFTYRAGRARLFVSTRPPLVDAIPNQIVAAGHALGPIAIHVQDPYDAESELTLNLGSSNSSLIDLANIRVEGTGPHRALFIQPTAGVTGQATVTVEAFDGFATSVTSFVVDVKPVSSPDDSLTVGDGVVTIMENVLGGDLGAVVVHKQIGDDDYQYFISDDRFEVVEGVLKLKSHVAFDHEVTNQVEFTLTAIDSLGFAVSREITLSVEDENEFSPEFEIASLSLDENSPPGTIVGSGVAKDKDSSQSLRFEFSTGSLSWDDRFEIDPHTGVIQTSPSFVPNFEEASSYTVIVRVTDDGIPPRSIQVPITITIEDVNDVPLGLLRPQSQLAENTPTNYGNGWTLGRFRAADEELRDPSQLSNYTYEIVSDDDHPDGQFFRIDPGKFDPYSYMILREGIQIDYETKNRYDILIRVTDGPHIVDFPYTLTILDSNEPPEIELGISGSEWHATHLLGAEPSEVMPVGLSLSDPEGVVSRLSVRIDSANGGEESLAVDASVLDKWLDDPGFAYATSFNELTGELVVETTMTEFGRGTFPIADAATILSAVTYRYLGDRPADLTRTITVSVGDQDFTSSPASFPLVIDSDRDGDGVATWIENLGPNGGDANQDGVADNGDARIATLLDSLDNPYTVVSCESVSIRDAGFQLAPAASDSVEFPAGLLTFALEGIAQQGACEIELLVSGDVDANSWWIVPGAGEPEAFVFDGMVGVRQRAGRTFLQLVDGGRGDADGVADGRILFQGLPSKMATSSLWHNSLLRADVNADGVVSPIDALLVINWINSEGAGSLPARSFLSAPFLDPNGDGDASPIDVAIVIQQLNQTAGGAGEATRDGVVARNELSVAALLANESSRIAALWRLMDGDEDWRCWLYENAISAEPRG